VSEHPELDNYLKKLEKRLHQLFSLMKSILLVVIEVVMSNPMAEILSIKFLQKWMDLNKMKISLLSELQTLKKSLTLPLKDQEDLIKLLMFHILMVKEEKKYSHII